MTEGGKKLLRMHNVHGYFKVSINDTLIKLHAGTCSYVYLPGMCATLLDCVTFIFIIGI